MKWYATALMAWCTENSMLPDRTRGARWRGASSSPVHGLQLEKMGTGFAKSRGSTRILWRFSCQE
jgi:hypothetical protein